MDENTVPQDDNQYVHDDNIVSEQDALDNSKNPERTSKYIDSLKDEQSKLKEDLQTEKNKYQNLIDSLIVDPSGNTTAPPKAQEYGNLNQKQVDDVFSSMVTDDGYVDANKLLEVLKDTDERARKAEERARGIEEYQKQQEIARQERDKSDLMNKVHQKYPSLDPESNEEFDPTFYDLVRNELIGQMMQGKEDPMAAADKWYNNLSATNMNKEETKQKEEKQNQKAQINATRPRSAAMAGYYEKNEQEDLMNKVKAGKKGALAEALRRHETRNK